MIRDVSTALHAEASQHLVGGVNSPVRAFKSVHGDPIYIKDAKGATITELTATPSSISCNLGGH
ncbi:MAG: hypothetical protein CM15mP128_5180 [Methanobacteriota archaeon]|nr:MAG: hypothetical protein CM15mP128_5180 [Euryarchaeota archaeon]